MSTSSPCLDPTADVSGQPVAIAEQDLNHPRTLTALRSLKLLVGGYVALSALALVAIFLLRNNHAAVNSAVWTRGTIVALSALLTLAFTVRTGRGSRRAYLRLRVVSAVMLAAIVVIIALPGTFPVWMKVEQGVCGFVLIGVAVVANGKHLRSVFAATS
jgi:hypothetical protein